MTITVTGANYQEILGKLPSEKQQYYIGINVKTDKRDFFRKHGKIIGYVVHLNNHRDIIPVEFKTIDAALAYVKKHLDFDRAEYNAQLKQEEKLEKKREK